MRSRRPVHFLEIDTREPLCGGEGQHPAGAPPSGVSLCDVCVRRLTGEGADGVARSAVVVRGTWPGGAGA